MSLRAYLCLLCAFAFAPLSVVVAEEPDSQIGTESSKSSSFWSHLNPRKLRLHSSAALVLDQTNQKVLYARDEDKPRPIASITKLMTAMVLLDSNEDMEKRVKVTSEDKDRKRYSRSRLGVGTELTRSELLQLALMASENRAAAALARTYPGGTEAFVRTMNRKAREIGMFNSRFVDPTGLDGRNMATAADLAKMVDTAYGYQTIREYSTKPWSLLWNNRSIQKFNNTNRLIRNDDWEIGLSKTGFLNEAGHCLVMQANIDNRPVLIILLNSWGKFSRFGDANRIRNWLLKAQQHQSVASTS